MAHLTLKLKNAGKKIKFTKIKTEISAIKLMKTGKNFNKICNSIYEIYK